MIGLELICRVFRYEYKELGEKIGVSQATIQDWLKKRRNIPSARLEQLSLVFKGIPKEYFQKELTKSEEAEVQIIHLQQTDTRETVDVPVTDNEGNIVAWREESYSAHAGIIDFLVNQQEIDQIIERVKELVAEDEASKKLINQFIDVLERGKDNQTAFLMELLIHMNGKKETLFLDKYEDLEQFLSKYNLSIPDEPAK